PAHQPAFLPAGRADVSEVRSAQSGKFHRGFRELDGTAPLAALRLLPACNFSRESASVLRSRYNKTDVKSAPSHCGFYGRVAVVLVTLRAAAGSRLCITDFGHHRR